jgi:hypothetical protein
MFLSLVLGTVSMDDYANYTKYIEQLFSENPNLVAFAPDSTNDDWSGLRSKIKDLF